jgi:hypothetical protein
LDIRRLINKAQGDFMRTLNFLIIIIASFFVFGCSNSDSNKETVQKNEEVKEKHYSDDKKILSVYDNENLKTIEGIKNYLHGGWSLVKENNTIYYYFDKDSLIHYIVASQEFTEKLKDNKKFIEKSKQFSKARENKIIYQENGVITYVKDEINKTSLPIEIIDENSFSIGLEKEKSIFKRDSIEKPIVGEIYQKLDK